MQRPPKAKKLVVVGDKVCGQMNLLAAFIHKDADYIPTVIGNQYVDIEVNNQKVQIFVVR